MSANLKRILIVIPVLIALNLLGSWWNLRLDLTRNKRYTLSEASITMAEALDQPVVVDVLLEGNLPPEFKRLQLETRQMLEEFKAVNPRITYNFMDPLDPEEGDPEALMEELQSLGLQPASITTEEGSSVSQQLVFPWALVNTGQQTVKVPLLKNKLGADSEERVRASVQQLEYALADAFHQLGLKERRKIAVLKGNGELPDRQIADWLGSLGKYYHLAPFTLDSVAGNPNGTLNALKQFDLVIAAKPSIAFSDSEKLVLDQYLMHGGKALWLIDQVQMELDSLFLHGGKSIALPASLELEDLFFRYGFRVNPSLVADMYATQIVLATNEGNAASFTPVPWLYAPLVLSRENHPINTNIQGLRMQFSNPIDTLKNDIRKTVLLESSPLSKVQGTPLEIDLAMVSQAPDKESFTPGNYPLAVLLEGAFESGFRNRILPFEVANRRDKGEETAMIIIADGDIARNDLQNGRPLELGYDKWTSNFYGNKEFLMNCVNYLLDDNGLINIRAREVSLAFLDKQKLQEEKSSWKLVNLGVPLLILLLYGGLFRLWKRQKYGS